MDGTGRCQAMNYPTQGHLFNVLSSLGLDHILHYPPEFSTNEPGLVVYLSLTSSVILLVYPEGQTRNAPAPKDLVDIYRWVQQYAKVHAYRFVTTHLLRPNPNESKATRDKIMEWCDGHLDAFTVFHCKQNILGKTKPRKRPRA